MLQNFLHKISCLGRCAYENKSDFAGIQTQDLQNRNLTLYSAKLRSQM